MHDHNNNSISHYSSECLVSFYAASTRLPWLTLAHLMLSKQSEVKIIIVITPHFLDEETEAERV